MFLFFSTVYTLHFYHFIILHYLLFSLYNLFHISNVMLVYMFSSLFISSYLISASYFYHFINIQFNNSLFTFISPSLPFKYLYHVSRISTMSVFLLLSFNFIPSAISPHFIILIYLFIVTFVVHILLCFPVLSQPSLQACSLSFNIYTLRTHPPRPAPPRPVKQPRTSFLMDEAKISCLMNY